MKQDRLHLQQPKHVPSFPPLFQELRLNTKKSKSQCDLQAQYHHNSPPCFSTDVGCHMDVRRRPHRTVQDAMKAPPFGYICSRFRAPLTLRGQIPRSCPGQQTT